jgi:membrane protease YdiL (CAAX protease family)
LRARVFVSAVGVVLVFYGATALIALGILAAMPAAWRTGQPGLVASSLPVVMAALSVNALLVWRSQTTWGQLGWPGMRVGGRGLLQGVAVGGLMAGCAVSTAVVAGGARLVYTGEPWATYGAAAATLGLGLAVAALAEELLFRGFPLARLAEVLTRPGASLLLAVLFISAHLSNPDTSIPGLVNVGLAALVLSAAFFLPGGMPLAWGVHWGWNGGLALGADAPVSGLRFDLPVIEFETGGRSWLTGGAFGPEGGLAATAVMVLALIWFGRRVDAVGKGEPA